MAHICEKNVISMSSFTEEIKSIEITNADFLVLCKDYREDDLLKLIQATIEQGADVNQTDANKKNSIELLCENYNAKDFMPIISCIIQSGFDIKKHNSSVLRSVLDSSMDQSQQNAVLRLLTRYGLDFYLPYNLIKLRKEDGSIRITFINFLIVSKISLGWHHEECLSCQQILLIDKFGRGVLQHQYKFLNVYRSFDILQFAQESADSTLSEEEVARSCPSDALMKAWKVDEDKKTILYQIQYELKDLRDNSRFNCKNYELYLRTICNAAESLNHENVVEEIKWNFLLPFDFSPRPLKLSSSHQELVNEWDKTLENSSHEENDEDFGELLESDSRLDYINLYNFDHKCHDVLKL